jgi:alkanesulfonate monooxygenase SsuD/methylene tetrahydromethanopterin reductase-like flavin-dependent oxidoreductase (luciferase family)
MQALIGGYADEFNTVGGTPEEVAERFERARRGCRDAGRDPDTLVTSLMTWFFVASTEDAYLEKLERARSLDPTAGPFDAYRRDIERDCIVGTPARAAARLREYRDAGVRRIYLNHELYDDLDMLELVAAEVLPRLEG